MQRLLPDFAKDDLASIARFAAQAASQFGAGIDQIVEFIVPQLETNGRNVEEFNKLFREQQAEAQAAANDTDIVVAGLVGRGGGGLTAMTFAAREGDVESTTLLVAAGADINQITEYGWTPLLTATNNRHYQLATWLVEHGAEREYPEQGRLDAAVSRDRQPQHRRRRLPGAQAGHERPRIHQGPAGSRRQSRTCG